MAELDLTKALGKHLEENLRIELRDYAQLTGGCLWFGGYFGCLLACLIYIMPKTELDSKSVRPDN